MKGNEYEEGRDDGAKVDLVRILDDSKDENRSPAPVVYGIMNRKLSHSPTFFPQNSLGQLRARRARQCERGPSRGEKEDREDLASIPLLLSSPSAGLIIWPRAGPVWS